MPDNEMDRFSRDKINMTMNLKKLCVSQMEAIYGLNETNYDKFVVLQCKFANKFVAHAIIQYKNNGSPSDAPSWKCLLTGESIKGVFYALEHLWIQLQGAVSEPAKRIRPGETSNVWS
ncbi:hypothetical protein G6514_003919 [Epicoccum nigrum]|nr:hypothetical protein G6514_003919 [Epicoccum nigrum]